MARYRSHASSFTSYVIEECRRSHVGKGVEMRNRRSHENNTTARYYAEESRHHNVNS